MKTEKVKNPYPRFPQEPQLGLEMAIRSIMDEFNDALPANFCAVVEALL